jgi:hypothetical protein
MGCDRVHIGDRGIEARLTLAEPALDFRQPVLECTWLSDEESAVRASSSLIVAIGRSLMVGDAGNLPEDDWLVQLDSAEDAATPHAPDRICHCAAVPWLHCQP